MHWADGGPTNLDNLALLCGFHHRALHEGGLKGRFEYDPVTESPRLRVTDEFGHEIVGSPDLLAPKSVTAVTSAWDNIIASVSSSGLKCWKGERLELDYVVSGLMAHS